VQQHCVERAQLAAAPAADARRDVVVRGHVGQSRHLALLSSPGPAPATIISFRTPEPGSWHQCGLRWFAEYQPFTPITEALRGLLTGGPVASHAAAAGAWCAGIALVSYLWARRRYDQGPQLGG
jgi:hypothetical protein